MASYPKDIPVVIVGGGPTGLTTANLLATYGVDCILLEREALDHEEIVALFGARPGTDRLAPLAAETR